jgi:rod shape-determining protein MreC
VRNIFLFIRRYFNLLFFLLLQAVCIYFIVSYSKYHQAAFAGTANKLTGSINKQYNKVEYYFELKRTNDSLVKANEMLYNKLRADYNIPDSLNKVVIDTIRVDSISQYRKFNYLSAKVVSNSVSSQANYIVIYGDNVKKFKVGMGIAGINNTVVGIVTEVDGSYATVMSLLHKDSHINGLLPKANQGGQLSWNGEKPNIISLSNISKGSKVAKGDTVFSGRSAIFPRGMLIGTVLDVKPETANTNLKIDLHTFTDFYTLEYVYGIESADAGEIKKLLDKAKASVN